VKTVSIHRLLIWPVFRQGRHAPWLAPIFDLRVTLLAKSNVLQLTLAKVGIGGGQAGVLAVCLLADFKISRIKPLWGVPGQSLVRLYSI